MNRGITFALAVLVVSPSVFAAPQSDSELVARRAKTIQTESQARHVMALWQLSDALIERGGILEAERSLRLAAGESTDSALKLGTAVRLGAALTLSGHIDEAHVQLKSVESAIASLTPEQLIRLRQAEGNLAVRIGDLTAAEDYFTSEASAAHGIGATAAEARARINALRARLDAKNIAELEKTLDSLYIAVTSLPGGEETAKLLLAVGDLCERAVQEFRSPLAYRGRAFAAFELALHEATSVATQAFATGHLGALYEDEGRNAEALQLTFRATTLTQSIDAQDQLYRWESQAGRIEQKMGEKKAAAQAFDRALFTLSMIRDDVLQSSRRAFSQRIEPVYLAYADIHLRESTTLPEGGADQQRVLRDVRDRLESLKQAEVQDYFDNACAVSGVADQSRQTSVPGVAIIYPILLADRTDVLIEIGGILQRFSSPASRGEVTAAVRRLRIGLEHPSAGDEYRQPAQALYGWLLAEAAPWLASQKVDTLVFVPSGPLRTVPLAVLLDGDKFLIERYAIATTPAISLIPTLAAQSSEGILIAGLTKSVQGFPSLPAVGEEIRSIGAMFRGASLKDEAFSLASIRSDLSARTFSVAHLATHGEFNADHRLSFILTYDSRLTMDGLQAALGQRQEPLDLLVLSACSTAAGDDRAALGLAGIAIQAGAKSALASLWSISDEATALLMSTFYKTRKAGGETKAQSLRDAQLALLQSAEYRHPSYWSPYLLIGNWL